jgi:hypothetical protein
MNKLMNDEIVCDIFDDEFEKKYFSKLIVDGNTNNGTAT